MKRRVTPLILIVVLAVASTAATCNQQTARHQTTIGIQTVTAALSALQDFEGIAYQSGIGKITPAQHQAFGAKMVIIWTGVEDATKATLAWQVGAPIPTQVVALADSLERLVNDAAALLPGTEESRAKVAAVTLAGFEMMVLAAKIAGG